MTPQLRFSVSLLSVLLGCSRQAEIRDDPDTGGVTVAPDPLPDGGVPEVADAGLDIFPECTTREIQNCKAANDFPCDFPRWIRDFIAQCRPVVDCTVAGWLSVHMSVDGCVDSIGMTEPHAEFVACLVERVGGARCTCSDDTENVYLGAGLPFCPEGDGGPSGSLPIESSQR